jgi:hypothetical protein
VDWVKSATTTISINMWFTPRISLHCPKKTPQHV